MQSAAEAAASGAGQGWETVCIKTMPFGPVALQGLQNLVTEEHLALQQLAPPSGLAMS